MSRWLPLALLLPLAALADKVGWRALTEAIDWQRPGLEAGAVTALWHAAPGVDLRVAHRSVVSVDAARGHLRLMPRWVTGE